MHALEFRGLARILASPLGKECLLRTFREATTALSRGGQLGLLRTSALPALLASQAAVAVTGLAISRYSEPAVKGAFTSVHVWSAFAFTVAALSLPHAVIALGEKAEGLRLSPKLRSFIFGLSVLLGAFAASILLAKGAIVGLPQYVLVACLPLLMVAFETASSRALLMESKYSLARLLQALTFLIAVLIVIGASGGVTALVGALALSYLVPLALARPAATAPKEITLRQFLAWSSRAHLGLVLSAVAGKLDLLVVSVAFDRRNVGLYAAAASLAGLTAFIGNGLGIMLSARLVRSEHARRTLIELLTVVMVPVLGVVIISAAAPGKILLVLFGSDYIEGASLVPILAIAAIPWTLSTLGSHAAVGLNMPSLGSRSQALTALCLLTFSILGATIGSLNVVAVGTIAGYTVGVVTQWPTILRATR